MDLSVDGLTFQPALDADYEELWQLRRTTIHEHVLATWGWDEAWQAQRFRAHWRPEQFTIIERGGEHIGMFALRETEDGRGLLLANVAIAPAHQSQGIGTAVIGAITAGARAQGRTVRLTVLKVNRARRLYERLGFVIVSESEADYAMEFPVRGGDPNDDPRRRSPLATMAAPERE
jgi:ribosomal protein S18 acetylase RimI-like enzyme